MDCGFIIIANFLLHNSYYDIIPQRSGYIAVGAKLMIKVIVNTLQCVQAIKYDWSSIKGGCTLDVIVRNLTRDHP